MLFDLFVNILAHNLSEPAYEADVAQLEYKLVAGEHGLVVRLKGFNHKLPVRTHTCTDTQSCRASSVRFREEAAEQLERQMFPSGGADQTERKQ